MLLYGAAGLWLMPGMKRGALASIGRRWAEVLLVAGALLRDFDEDAGQRVSFLLWGLVECGWVLCEGGVREGERGEDAKCDG